MERSAPYLQVSGISKRYGGFAALDNVSFDIDEGEFICFLGPSGCGKTTLLRCIAGLETQSEGSIVQAGRDISALPASQRDFGIVFQSYALFPNLTVGQNVAYGLVNKKMSRDAIRKRVHELLTLVGLLRHETKYPGQLSGGEQQRVALVRALAISPGLLLLDEPLSALDAKVRSRLRREIRELQNKLGVTTVMVTHDQEEAQTMADRVLVMRRGRLEQIGTPREIYDRPATRFIADFIGVMNFLPATVHGAGQVRVGSVDVECDTAGHADGAVVEVAFRPEDASVATQPTGAGNTLETTLGAIEHLGSFERLLLGLPAPDMPEIKVDIRKGTDLSSAAHPGARVFVTIPGEKLTLYAQQEGA